MVANKAPISIHIKYFGFADVSPKLSSKLFKSTEINDHAIELVDEQQLLYRPIYSLKLIELETLKTYIKTNLANGFISFSKSSAKAPILFDKKIK